MKAKSNTIIKAYEAATHNFDIAVNSNPPIRCGCFHCKRIFMSNLITEEDYYEELNGQDTVACPYCGLDSVIVESPDLKITKDLIREVNEFAFSGDDEFPGDVCDMTV